ncbi:MAG: radical SAM protein [bacterium]
MNEIRKPDTTLKKLLPAQKPRPGIKYIPSQFAYPFERDGRQYVYNTLTKQFVEAALPTQAMAGEGYDELIGGYFLVPEGKDECAFYESISTMMRAYSRKKAHRGYTILPTLACNARCVYCYEEGRAQVTMTPEIVEQTIKFILDTHEGDKVHLSWFGGEPLLRPDMIDRICEGLREAGLEYKSSVISNGSLITPAIIEKMKGSWNVKNIQISMDGAEADYIRRKRYFKAADQYHDVMRNINMLAETGIVVSIRCNVDENNWEDIPAFIEDLKANIQNRSQVGVYFVPLNEVRESERGISMWRRIVEISPMIAAAGFRRSGYMRSGSNFRVNHCMADANSVVICPDGSLYACEHCPPEAHYGDIFNGVTDEAARKAFCAPGPMREKCRGCAFLPECTAYPHCPIQDTHCKEVRNMMEQETLNALLDRKSKEQAEDDPVC